MSECPCHAQGGGGGGAGAGGSNNLTGALIPNTVYWKQV